MKRLPFRRRLTIWSTLVAAVSIAICGAGAAWFVYQRKVAEIDRELEQDTSHFFAEFKRHGGAAFNWATIEHEVSEWLPQRIPPTLIEIRTGETVRWRSRNLNDQPFPRQPPGISQSHIGSREVRLLTAEQGGATFSIASDLNEARSLAQGLALAMLAGSPLALAFAWLGGRKLAAIAVAPIEQMSVATETITAARLDQRVPVPEGKDEIQRHARVLNATLDRLEQSYHQAMRFSGDASHELKTPLTVLRSSIEALLESNSLGDDDRAAISGLLEQTRRLTTITSSLLLLSRADAGRLVLDVATHDIAALTGACAEDARIVAEERNVQVECALLPSAPAKVDPIRFSQIASNLLDNAVKYNRPGGVVRAALEDEGKVWRLSVANTGPGISPEHRAHLFERFYRIEHTAIETGHGLGLGLARELARAHGGDVALVRSEDGWTEFELTLPKNGARRC